MIDTSKTYTSNRSGDFKIVEYINNKNIIVEFISTSYRTKVMASKILLGKVKDRSLPVVHGVGFIGDGEYKSRMNGERYKPYQIWMAMLQRCYSESRQKSHETYTECTVCTEWHNFQNFASWYEENHTKGLHLDKDIKIKGNKIYSPETCSFVTHNKNTEEANAKSYNFISPEGVLTNIYNMNTFCKGKSLDPSCMIKVSKGKRKQHKGWRKS